MSELIARDRAVIASTYNRFPVEIASGKGSVYIATDGREYIDMGTGIGVTAFGIADEEWKNAVKRQLDCVQHTSNLYYTEPCVRLAELLTEKTGMKKVFFANSGAEANECAIKVARKYTAEQKGAEYNVILTLENGFHGRTLTTLAATGQAHYHELYQPLTPGFAHTPANDLEALEKAFSAHKVAALLIECIQGEGGVNVLTPAFVKGAEAICRKNGALLMIDEVQTGNGRTGSLYAYMQYGVSPDVVTTAKGLGGGLPIGACLLSERVENVFAFGDHGSTFGGNPVAAAGACSILSRIDGTLLSEVKEKGEYLMHTFKNAKGVRSVSGMGLMIGIETERPAAEVVKTSMENGVLCLTAKNKVRLLPALNIPMEILEKAVAVILAAIAEGV